MQDTPPSLRTPRAPVLRRAVLGAGVGGVLVLAAGCTTSSTSDPPARGGTGSGSDATDAATGDADQQLVDSVLGDLGRTRTLVTAARRRHDDLAAPLAGLARLHRAHGRELGGAGAATSSTSGQGTRPAARATIALRQVTAAEQNLQDRLVSAAVEARSGVLAGLLASMAAAVAQELTLLAAAGDVA